MREERKSEYQSENRNVVNAKVREIFPDAGGSFREGIRAGKGGTVDQFGPRASLREALAKGGGEAVDKRAEGGGGDWRLRLGSSGGCGGGLGIRDRERRW